MHEPCECHECNEQTAKRDTALGVARVGLIGAIVLLLSALGGCLIVNEWRVRQIEAIDEEFTVYESLEPIGPEYETRLKKN